MTLQSLSRPDLRSRLAGRGVALQCGPLVMQIGSALRELAEPIRFLYQDFALADDELCDFDVRVERHARWRVGRQATTLVDGRPAFDPFTRRHALPMLEWAINWCTFTRPNQYLLLHAAVVERGATALLISGQPGAGKSTLTAALALRGWRLFSDEVAAIVPGSRHVLPLPRPLSLKNDSIDLIRRFSKEAAIGPSTPGTRKGTVAHMRPPHESVARADEPATPRWVVFPRFRAGASTEVRQISRAEALLRLGGESFNYSLLGTTGFETLADVVDDCLCFELTYGDLHESVTAVEDLTA
jgi:hypothetical protein